MNSCWFLYQMKALFIRNCANLILPKVHRGRPARFVKGAAPVLTKPILFITNISFELTVASKDLKAYELSLCLRKIREVRLETIDLQCAICSI